MLYGLCHLPARRPAALTTAGTPVPPPPTRRWISLPPCGAAPPVSVERGLLLAAASAFAVVSGVNDGGTLIALSIRTYAVDLRVAVGVLVAAVAVGPFLVGTAVATTLAHRLVSFERSGGGSALLVSVAASLAVVFALSRLGTPTSLTLALTGAIVGAGLGAGFPVSWGVVGMVLAIGLAAPLVSIVAGFAALRLLGGPPGRFIARRSARIAQHAGLVAQSLAYSANDAQKMVAVMAIAIAPRLDPVPVRAASQAALTAFFALGMLFGVRPIAGQVGERLIRIRPSNAIATAFSSSAVVFTSAFLGAPISSTQSATMALLGTGMGGSPRHVRWPEVLRVGRAWAVTLPLAVGLAAGGSALVRVMR